MSGKESATPMKSSKHATFNFSYSNIGINNLASGGGGFITKGELPYIGEGAGGTKA